MYGGGGDDDLHGGEPSSGVLGHVLFGDAGDDVLAAGSKGGQMEGGQGDDTIIGGTGFDEADYWHAPDGVRVDLALTGPQDTRGAGHDTLAGVEALEGSEHDDVLKGHDEANALFGGAGDDVLDGRGGADGLYGDDGADTCATAPATATSTAATARTSSPTTTGRDR